MKEFEGIPNLILRNLRFVTGPLSPPLNLDPGTFVAANLGKQLDDHYFGQIPSRVVACLSEIELEKLWCTYRLNWKETMSLVFNRWTG
jgi:hypothetical protein